MSAELRRTRETIAKRKAAGTRDESEAWEDPSWEDVLAEEAGNRDPEIRARLEVIEDYAGSPAAEALRLHADGKRLSRGDRAKALKFLGAWFVPVDGFRLVAGLDPEVGAVLRRWREALR
ncbi:MAG: hypothetical protein AAF447_18455 [Myxococcota bacterium]